MMKRLIALLLAGVMAFALCACKTSEPAPTDPPRNGCTHGCACHRRPHGCTHRAVRRTHRDRVLDLPGFACGVL